MSGRNDASAKSLPPWPLWILAAVVAGCAGKAAPSVQIGPPDGAAADVAQTSDTEPGASDTTSSNDGATRDEHASVDRGGCPSAPPFDDTDQTIIDQCTVPVAVAVGNALRRAITFDGQTWIDEVYMPSAGPDQNEFSHRDAVIARGLIVIVGDGGISTSFDGGATFSVTQAGRFHDAGITYFQGAIWALTNLGTFASTDGKTWQSWLPTMSLPGGVSGDFPASSGVAASGSKLVATTWRTNSMRVFDGTTWTHRMLDSSYGSLSKTTFGGGRFLILSDACCDKAMYAGLRATSTDGVAWTLLTNASPGSATYRWGDVLWDGAQFVANSTQYGKQTFVSKDGLTWDARPTNVGIGPMALLDGVYVGSQDGQLFRSNDAITWTMTHTAIGDKTVGFVHIRSGRVLRP
jgi:hypothetical protein